MNCERSILNITRESIEATDCTPVLHALATDALSPAALQRLFGNVELRFTGYEAHPDALFLIPEFRRFVRQWRELQPHWMFFPALEGPNLKYAYLGLLDHVDVVQVERVGLCRVVFPSGELHRLVAADLAQADCLGEKVGVSAARRLKRLTAVVNYLHDMGGVE